MGSIYITVCCYLNMRKFLKERGLWISKFTLQYVAI